MTQDVSPDFSDTPAKHSEDRALDLKKRARRRLVGAIALVLLMLALLPMVLDDKHNRSMPQEIAISIPSQDDAGFSNKVIPTTPAEISQTTLPDSSQLKTPQPSDLTQNQPPLENSGLASADKAGNANVKTQSDEASRPSSKLVQQKESGVAEIPHTADAETQQKLDSPEQKNNSKQKSSLQKTKEEKARVSMDHPPVAGKTYTVQVGVFSDAAKVAEIQKKLQAHDVHATSTEKIETDKGEKIRLRAGSFANRQEAEHMLSKVQAAGFSGMVVSK